MSQLSGPLVGGLIMATALSRSVSPTAGVESSTGPGRPRRFLGFGLGPRRARRWAVFCVLFLVADVVIALIAIVLLRQHSTTAPQSKPPPTLPASTPTLARNAPAGWITQQLPHTAGVLAEGDMKAELAAAGFGKVVDAAGVTPGQVQYVVSTAALRDAAKNNAVIAQLLVYSAPIAAFGSGPDEIVVRQTTSTPQSTRDAHHAAGVQQRTAAERQLLANPKLHMNADATRVVRAGGLDMRAAAVLALLAEATPLRVQVLIDPAERAAGVPARRILITSSAPDQVHGVLAALPASYRLAADDRLSNGAERLTWPIDPDPAIPN